MDLQTHVLDGRQREGEVTLTDKHVSCLCVHVSLSDDEEEEGVVLKRSVGS